MHEHTERAAGEGLFEYAELVTPVEKEPHLATHRPNANFDLPRRAQRHVSAGGGFQERQPFTRFDPFHGDQSVAGQVEAIERIACGAEDEAVRVIRTAQADACGELGVEVSEAARTRGWSGS